MKETLPLSRLPKVDKKYDVMTGPKPMTTMPTMSLRQMFVPQTGLKLGTGK